MRYDYGKQMPRVNCLKCNEPMLDVGEQDPRHGFPEVWRGQGFCDCPDEKPKVDFDYGVQLWGRDKDA